MKSRYTPVGIALLLVLMVTGCNQPGQPSGLTLTVGVFGAPSTCYGKTAHISVFSQGANPSTASPLATGAFAVSGSGDGSQTIQGWTSSDGATYDVYIYVDINGNGTQDPGDYASIALTTTINGTTVKLVNAAIVSGYFSIV